MSETRTGANNHNWRGGRSITPTGYVLVRVGKKHHLSDVRGYAYEHRIKAEEKIGRPLLPSEHVHHVDHDRGNNAPENLEVLTFAEHRAAHRKRTNLRPVHGPNPIVSCACGCGGTFTKYDATNRPRVYLHGHNGHGSAR